MVVNRKGFTLIELLILVTISFIILSVILVAASVFIIPWILESKVGNDIDVITGYASIENIVPIDGNVTIKKDTQIRLDLIPPFASAEKIHIIVDDPADGMKIVKRPNTDQCLLWTPKQVGTYTIYINFFTSDRHEKRELTLIVEE